MKGSITCDARGSTGRLCVDPIPPRKPLRECVRDALEHYMDQLDGQSPGNLYQLVITETEAPLLETIMRYTRGNQTQAAELLGINRTTLRKKLKLYNIR